MGSSARSHSGRSRRQRTLEVLRARSAQRFQLALARFRLARAALLTCILLGGALVVGPAIAQAALPGTNGNITFIRGTEVWTVNPDGSGATAVASGDNEFPEFGPGGNRIAFGRTGGTGFELFAMNADGTSQIQLTPSDGLSDNHPTYSPDGSEIVFAHHDGSDQELFAMNADGSGTPTQLTTNTVDDYLPEYSPDGTKIAYTSFFFNEDVWVMNADGSGAPVNITKNPHGDNNAAPDWSPDGSKIAYMSDGDGDSEIYVKNSDGTGTPTQLTTNSIFDGRPAYSPDGSKIAFERGNDIYAMNAGGTGTTPVTSGAPFDSQADWGAGGTAALPTLPARFLEFIRKRQRVGHIEVVLRCGSLPCDIDLSGRAKARGIGSGNRAIPAAKRSFKLKRKTVSLDADQERKVRVRFKRNRKSVKKLRRLLKSKKVRRRSVVKVKARITAEDGSTAKSAVRIKLKR